MDLRSIKDTNDQEVLEHCVEKDLKIAARRAKEGTIRPSILHAVNRLIQIEAEKERSKKEPK